MQGKASGQGLAVLDTREPTLLCVGVCLRLEKLGASVVDEKLDEGDYLFIGETEVALVERKTLSDLESSFFTGTKSYGKRLDSQVAKMLVWKHNYQEEFPGVFVRARLMIVGSYIDPRIQLRLLTYQAHGLEVIWGENEIEMLVNQYKYTCKGKHEPPKVRPTRPTSAKKMPLKEQILLPLLNEKQRHAILDRFPNMLELAMGVVACPEEFSDLMLKKKIIPGIGPKTIAKLTEAFMWDVEGDK